MDNLIKFTYNLKKKTLSKKQKIEINQILFLKNLGSQTFYLGLFENNSVFTCSSLLINRLKSF